MEEELFSYGKENMRYEAAKKHGIKRTSDFMELWQKAMKHRCRHGDMNMTCLTLQDSFIETIGMGSGGAW